jgi:beta-lactam-binding protein with PASTA domain/predicted Ser/Thr protein kinase
MELVNDSPRVLGNRYEVGGLLGRGGMAEVHLGRDTRLGRTVAIKLLRADLARDSTFQARFRREAQSSAALNHPSIVAVYDTGEEQVVDSGGGVFNLPYIVMEYIEGRTLRDVLAEGHHLDVDAALDITTGVLAALEYSHRIGIVHRDIKPANVMLTPIGDVKVMDFGIARAMSDASSTMTATHAVIGTAQYLSPEQARGEQVDTRSDLYSAGCLLYELLTGRPPFTGDSPVAVAYQHVREAPIPPSQLVPGIPESVDRIVLHSLAKGRDERYQTASDFRADVEAARGGRQVYAAVPALQNSNATTQYIPNAGDVTGTRMAPAGMGGAGLLGGDTMGGAGRSPSGQDPYDAYGQNGGDYGQPPREQKSNVGPILVGLAVVVILALIGYFGVQALNGDNGTTTGDSTSIKISSVVNQKQKDAVETLVGQGFVDSNIKIEKASSDDVPEGVVKSQDPEAQTEVATPATTTVTLTVSSGPSSIKVPDVSGATIAEATKTLDAAGLKVGGTKTVDDSSVASGHVIRTNPKAGADAAPGDSVTLVVPAKLVAIPNDLLNQQYSDAKKELKALGLVAVPEYVSTDDEDAGTVLQSDPTAGTKVKPGSTVTLTVAKASVETTTTPAPPPTTPSTTPTPTTTTTTTGGTGNG